MGSAADAAAKAELRVCGLAEQHGRADEAAAGAASGHDEDVALEAISSIAGVAGMDGLDPHGKIASETRDSTNDARAAGSHHVYMAESGRGADTTAAAAAPCHSEVAAVQASDGYGPVAGAGK